MQTVQTQKNKRGIKKNHSELINTSVRLPVQYKV